MSTMGIRVPAGRGRGCGRRSRRVGPGDTLVVTKLDRLARSVPDARDLVDELTARKVRLNIGGSVHDPTDPVGGGCSPCWR